MFRGSAQARSIPPKRRDTTDHAAGVLTEPMTRASPTDLARAALYVRAVSTAELHLPPVTLAPSDGRRHRSALAPAAWMLVAASLPLVGLVSLLREQLDLNVQSPRPLRRVPGGRRRGLRTRLRGRRRGEPPRRRPSSADLARVPNHGRVPRPARPRDRGVLFAHEYAGFKIANPVGLVLAALFAFASGFVDRRPSFAPLVVRHRGTAPSGPRRHGRVVHPDGRRAAAAARAHQRRRLAQRARGDGRDRRGRLRRRGGPLLVRLSGADPPSAGQRDRLFHPARRGDGGCGADRRARLAR